MTAQIVFLDRGSIGPDIELTRPAFAHTWREHEQTMPAEIASRITGASYVISNKVPIDGAAMRAAPNLKHIAVSATGYDKIDVSAATRLGIEVSNVRGYAENSVPEHTIMLILALRRSLIRYARAVAERRWDSAVQFCLHDFPIKDLAGSRLCIVGKGALGSRVGELGSGFGMDVVFVARKGTEPGVGYVAWQEGIETADVLTLHCPLTAQNRHLIGAPELDAMKSDAVLVNTARGGLVDEKALANALQSGIIAGAAIDVLSEEPPCNGNVLLDMSPTINLIVTPHVAWAGLEAMARMWRQLIGNLEASSRGAPTNLVNNR